jgi:hypothetical protein
MAGGHSTDMEFAQHKATYAGFVRLAIAAVLVCAMTLFALMTMTVIGGTAFWIGLVGLIAGIIVVAITLASDMSWYPSLLVFAVMVVLSVLTL